MRKKMKRSMRNAKGDEEELFNEAGEEMRGGVRDAN